METNITYDINAFAEATNIMRQCIVNLSEKNARQQIAAMAMQAILSNSDEVYRAETCTEAKQTPQAIAKYALACADALIMELNKQK